MIVAGCLDDGLAVVLAVASLLPCLRLRRRLIVLLSSAAGCLRLLLLLDF